MLLLIRRAARHFLKPRGIFGFNYEEVYRNEPRCTAVDPETGLRCDRWQRHKFYGARSHHCNRETARWIEWYS